MWDGGGGGSLGPGLLLSPCAEQAGNANGEWKGRLVIAPPCLCVLGAGEIGKRREGWCGNV